MVEISREDEVFLVANKKIGITMSDETLEKLEAQAKNLGLSKSQFISMLVNQNFLESEAKK